MDHKIGIPPVENSDATLLILGTMPGDESLMKQEYYANSRNRFWKIISSVFNKNLKECNYEEKISFLKKNHIALWDVLKSAHRKGSADANILNERMNDLETFLKTHPKIKKIGFNGKTPREYFESIKSKLSLNGIELITLPSTSGANGYFKLEPWIEFFK